MIISTNILSDYSKEDFKYIVTPSAEAVSDEILNSLDKRYRCLSLIGSYGTGKSSFLYALGKSILGEAEYFPKLASSNSIVVKSIGQYESLLDQLGKALKTKAELDSIFKALKEIDQQSNRVYILLDEFGKLIEFSLKNNPKKETYFFQQIAEYINNELNNTILVSTLHQSIESYTQNINSVDVAEWEKVSGRFFSIVFNEPVEVVAQIVLKHFTSNRTRHEELIEMTNVAAKLNLIPSKFRSEELNFGSIGIMDGLTTFVAISLFRKYAQNERSVFSFLNDPSSYGLSSFTNSRFTLPDLYDYVLNRFSHVIYSTINPDKLQWEAAERAIQRADSHQEINPEVSHRILKTIHLINLFSKEAGKFNSEELITYLQFDRPIDFKKIIDHLFAKNIIQYVNYKGRLTFVEGTDVNLEEELKKASGKLSLNANYEYEIKKLFSLDPIVAKQHLFRTGTPRLWYTTIQVDHTNPTELAIVLPTNGLISIYSQKDLESPHEIFGAPVLKCLCTIKDEIKSLIERIRKFEIIIEAFKEDNVVRNLVQLELDYATRELKASFLRTIYSEGNWTYLGTKLEIYSSRSLNSQLSEIFDSFYHGHPKVNNELINRSKISASINTARKRLIDNLLIQGGVLNFPKNTYPPERMIYDSTLIKEGIICQNSNSFTVEQDSSYYFFWQRLDMLFEESRHQKRPFSDCVDLLKSKPIGMKDGLIKLFLSYYLIANNDSFALTHEPTSKFLPFLHVDSIEAMFSKPKEFYIKKYNFDKVSKTTINSLFQLLNIDQTNRAERSAFFGIFAQLTRSFNQLPSYTRKTQLGLQTKTISLRDSIEQATDPEKALLIDLPIGLGYKPLTELSESEFSNFYNQLEVCLSDLSSAFPRLVLDFKSQLLEKLGAQEVGLSAEREYLRELISTINIETLGSQTKIILKRMLSPLDDEILYWKAILDAVAEFNIESIHDEQIEIVRQKINISAEAIQNLLGMIKTGAANIGITLTNSDGSTKRKFSNQLSEIEVKKTHAIVLTYFEKLDSRTRFNLLTHLIQKEL
jgi:hypothetical protein